LAVAADKTPMDLTVFLVLLRLLLVVGVAMEITGIIQVNLAVQAVAVRDPLLVLVVRGRLGRVMQVLKGKVL
jgi:hypothetical protein